jgi:uncharacterized protein
MLSFGWDPIKAKRNIRVHGISFDEASTAFKDTFEENAKRSRHA